MDLVTCIELEGVDHFNVIDPHSNAWAITIKEWQACISASKGPNTNGS
jgi:hypothetical protein